MKKIIEILWYVYGAALVVATLALFGWVVTHTTDILDYKYMLNWWFYLVVFGCICGIAQNFITWEKENYPKV